MDFFEKRYNILLDKYSELISENEKMKRLNSKMDFQLAKNTQKFIAIENEKNAVQEKIDALLETAKDRRKKVKDLKTLNRDLVNALMDAIEYTNDGTIKGDETLMEKYFELIGKAVVVNE